METAVVNALDSHFHAGYAPRQRKDERENNGFPQRLSSLRKERNLTHQAVAYMVGPGVTRGSADQLLFGKAERGPDEDLRLQFEAISRSNEEEKKVVGSVLEGLLLTHEARRWSNRSAASAGKENTR